MVYVVDTHALVWYLEESPNLSQKVFSILDDSSSRLVIPTIVLAEIKYLFNKNKISLPFEKVLSSIEEDNRTILFPLDLNVLSLIPEELDIHDGIICATALVYQNILQQDSVLITKDKQIKSAKIIKTIW